MALGPKAMGEAIIANLKSKTGRDLDAWQSELRAAGISDPDRARRHLKELGLGQFQAATVVEHHFGTTAYGDDDLLVDDQFARFPEQRPLYDRAVTALGHGFTPKPCRSYLPVYRDGRIAVSFTPTKNGLYAALTLPDPEAWPDRVAHKPSLGGSTRLKDGVYLADTAAVDRLAKELR
jgi:hypothetical protein